MQNRLTVIAEPLTLGKIPYTLDTAVVVTFVTQVNKLIATLLLAEATAQTSK